MIAPHQNDALAKHVQRDVDAEHLGMLTRHAASICTGPASGVEDPSVNVDDHGPDFGNELAERRAAGPANQVQHAVIPSPRFIESDQRVYEADLAEHRIGAAGKVFADEIRQALD